MIRLPRPNQRACRGAAALSSYAWLQKEFFLSEAKTPEERKNIEAFLAWIKRAGDVENRHQERERNPFLDPGYCRLVYRWCPWIEYPMGK